jgi:hypothetical protein
MTRCAAVKKKGSLNQCTANAVFGHSFCGIHARAKSAEVWKDAREKDKRVVKCQSVARGWITRYHLRLAGPGVLCRKDLANDEDLVTCEDVHRQHPLTYFAFVENGKVWWFDFDTLWVWSMKSLEPTNPYTRTPLPIEVRKRLREMWALRYRRSIALPPDPVDVDERMRCRWTMLCQTFVDNGFTDVTVNQMMRLGKTSHIAIWRFLREDAPIAKWQCEYMLSHKMLSSNAPTYIINSLRLLMKVVTFEPEPYAVVFNVMSSIFRC